MKSKNLPNILSVREQKYFRESLHSLFCSFIVVIPTDNVVIQWVDYLYESIHKDEIRDQLDFDAVATDLGIERDSLDLCLELGGTNRISTARQLLKCCMNYDEAIRQEHCWQNIDETIVAKICSKCLNMIE